MISARLGERELVSLEISRFIKDVSYIVGREGSFESAKLSIKSLSKREGSAEEQQSKLLQVNK